MSRINPLALVAGLVLVPFVSSRGGPSTAATEGLKPRVDAAPRFMRLLRDEDGAAAKLQTAIVRYEAPVETERDPTGEDDAAPRLVVDLIAAIHVADRSYYKDLEEQFEQYDVLLYELVKPQGAPVPDGRPIVGDDLFSALADAGLQLLDLSSQKDHIDYTRANFVHADMSPDEMVEAMRARGDDVFTVTLGVLADALRQQNLMEMERATTFSRPATEFDPLELLLDPDGPMEMKRLFAEELANAGPTSIGPTLNTILVEDRNAACMRAFQRELARGKTRIGIFFGAAHMPDFDRRLRDEFGLTRGAATWRTAWDMR